MTEEELDELRKKAAQRTQEWLATAPADSPFRHFLIANMGQAYMFGIIQAVTAQLEPPEKVLDVLAETIGTILADAALRTADIHNPKNVAAYFWHMSARISLQFTREIEGVTKAPAPPSGAH